MELSQHPRTGDFLLSQASGTLSMENGILAEGQYLDAGTVLGQALTASAATAVGTPTGNGVITVGAIGQDAQAGTYKLACVAAASNAGTFNFYGPNGELIRQVAVGGGAEANDHIVITIADGSSDFVVGDSWTIAVAGGDYSELAPAATDGTQIAAGLLYAVSDATDAAVAILVVVRNAEVKIDGVIWPVGITTPQTAAAIAQLNRSSIFLR
jgi:hypothetical protein